MELFQQIGLDGIIPRSVSPLIFVVVLIFSTKSDGNPITNSKTEYLESYSKLMKSYMNLSTDPCDDFFEYACGNYRNSSPLRFRISSVNEFTNHLAGKMEHLMGRMDLAESINATSELRMAQRFYKVCQAGYQQPFLATDPNYLTHIRDLGGFPAVDGATWNVSEFDWMEMSRRSYVYGVEGLTPASFSSPSFYDNEPVHLGFDTIIQRDITASNSSQVYRLNEERMRGYLRSFKLPEEKIREVIEGVFAFWRKFIMLDSDQFGSIDEVCTAHPEAVANYLAMKLLYTFETKHNASKTQGDYCETTMRNTMGYLFNKLFMAEYLTEETKLELKEVRGSLEKSVKESEVWPFVMPSFKDSLYYTPFMSREENLLVDELIQLIGRMEIVDDSYAATNINLQLLSFEISEFKWHKYLFDSFLGDNYYLAILLQPPFYHPSWPLSMKFSALSFVLASELLQHVDFSWEDQPSQFNDNVKCFQDRYNTTEQYILDFASLQLGYAAFQNQKKDLKQEEVSEQMPGLDLSPDQLYFLGFAQSLCYDYKYENGLKKYDILGSLSSSEAFNCPVGSRMRPTAETCRLF